MPILDFTNVELFFNSIAIIDQFSAFFAHRTFTILLTYPAHSYTTKLICVNYRLRRQILAYNTWAYRRKVNNSYLTQEKVAYLMGSSSH